MKTSLSCKTEQLRRKFPELTDAHQQYILGVTEGLLFAQWFDCMVFEPVERHQPRKPNGETMPQASLRGQGKSRELADGKRFDVYGLQTGPG
jgi:hypothetical protein